MTKEVEKIIEGLEKAIEVCKKLNPDYPELFQFEVAIEREIEKQRARLKAYLKK